MYDTINFTLSGAPVEDVDLLAEIPNYLADVSEHYYGDCLYLLGRMGNLKVSVSRHQVKVKDGSLCKWYLGDNTQTMTRKDVEFAIEKLSDTLHLPIEKATITRLDVATNFVVKQPPDNYINHLGIMPFANRLQQPHSVYYNIKDGVILFYDKVRELKSKGEVVPEVYDGRFVLRYEQRYTGRLASAFGVPEVNGSILYNEQFYIKVLNQWHTKYKSIQKINDVSLNFEQMKTKQELYKMGVLSLIQQRGGQLPFLAEIAEAQKRGTLTKKQAYDLRNTIKEVCQKPSNFIVPNEAIKELDKKVAEAVKHYR